MENIDNKLLIKILIPSIIISSALFTVLFFFCESLNETQNKLLGLIGGAAFVIGVLMPLIVIIA